MKGKNFKSEKLESLAYDLLRIYKSRSGRPLRLPIQADLVAESVGLNILWDEITEEPGTTVCAEICPNNRLIVVNDRRCSLLEETTGLYNTTVAHELGHWWLHVDHNALDNKELPGIIQSFAPPRQPDGRDETDERNAHKFMGYLLMPRKALLERARGLDLQSWRGLYRLRDDFDVTITAMKIRLEKLGLTYVDDNGRFHRSRQEAAGQNALF